ncbi:Iron-binding zinc finger CDGSH type [Maioricimonas rarisocia]|uniref:Iron-binding zinc finger CDGSH type n=1 Tax=Maioricimonas rarisocia TaxID=2528026 RepID=A0A517Z9Y1_9PLAN|nr:CDGSH iron-sulfur domain-containing protein [Maioricimonas rarisocia]QDU39294.1 Iron-binding zinc finger CDGSH type [Maioricimonas rarisocia]
MSEVTINCRENGPFLVTGPAKVLDHQGKEFDLKGKQSVALCRCGASKNRPFCDGSHKECGFLASETAE